MLNMIAFIVLALVVLVAAANCVSSRNIIHGAYWLLLTAIGIAGMTWFLGAEYIAIVQLLIYAGAVGILTVFSVMVTARSYEGATRETKLSWSALALALAFFALVAYGVIATPTLANFYTINEAIPLAEFGKYLFDIDGHAFAFEIASLVLLLALIAAVWWTKDTDDKAVATLAKAAELEDGVRQHAPQPQGVEKEASDGARTVPSIPSSSSADIQEQEDNNA